MEGLSKAVKGMVQGYQVYLMRPAQFFINVCDEGLFEMYDARYVLG